MNPTLGFKQVMIALEMTLPVVTPNHQFNPYSLSNVDNDLQSMVAPEHFRYVFYDTNQSELAGHGW
jgi:hypothetical protein